MSPAGTTVTWDQAVDTYIAEARARNLSYSTIESYLFWLKGPRFERIREARGIVDVADFDRDALIALEADVRRDGRSPLTTVQAHRVFGTFVRYARDRGWLDATEILGAKTPKAPLRAPDTFTDAEIDRLLMAARCDRDRVLVRFMLGTGMRLSEVVSVTLDDIVEDGRMVRVVQGKGGKDRYVPLGLPGRPLARLLAWYVTELRPLPAEDPERRLWLTERRAGGWAGDDAGCFVALTPEGLYRVIDRLGRSVGMHAHPHRFRHTWATRCLAAGMTAEAVKRAGGWGSYTAMSRYLHFAMADVMADWARAGGLAKLPPAEMERLTDFQVVPMPSGVPQHQQLGSPAQTGYPQPMASTSPRVGNDQ